MFASVLANRITHVKNLALWPMVGGKNPKKCVCIIGIIYKLETEKWQSLQNTTCRCLVQPTVFLMILNLKHFKQVSRHSMFYIPTVLPHPSPQQGLPQLWCRLAGKLKRHLLWEHAAQGAQLCGRSRVRMWPHLLFCLEGDSVRFKNCTTFPGNSCYRLMPFHFSVHVACLHPECLSLLTLSVFMTSWYLQPEFKDI